MNEAMLAEMQRKLAYLSDRQEIYDCICRYARGVDRHDPEIILSVYHADALDEHGKQVHYMDTFPHWATTCHDEAYDLHTHNITSHLCEIDGDVAHAESYVMFGLARKHEPRTVLGGGRYIDRLERRDGKWAIALRKCLVDWMLEGDATHKTERFKNLGYAKGAHDRTDPAYHRPLKPTAS
jgi:hypothetical protein